MSSSEEDWEKSSNEEEGKKKEEEKKGDFSDEDNEEIKKKRKQEAKEEAERLRKEAEENKRTKQSKKVDYDAQFAKRQAALAGGVQPTTTAAADTKGMSAGAKGMILEVEAEKGLTDQLFGGMDEPAPVNLNSEKDYKNFGTKTAKVLYAGSAPYRIENFFRELCKELPEHCDSKQMQKIIDHLSIKQKELSKKEKEARDGANKKKAKATLKGGGGKSTAIDDAMINDVMGADYGEDADYGAEGFQREQEAEYDFM